MIENVIQWKFLDKPIRVIKDGEEIGSFPFIAARWYRKSNVAGNTVAFIDFLDLKKVGNTHHYIFADMYIDERNIELMYLDDLLEEYVEHFKDMNTYSDHKM